MNLGGRTVLLTGATGGIGAATARALAARGATVIAVRPARRAARGARRRARRARASRPTSPSRDAPGAAARGGRATSTCSSPTPALPASGELTSFSPEEIDRALDVNLRAPIMLARLLRRAMVARAVRAPRVRLLAVGQGRRARTPRSTRRRSSGCAGSRSALRQDLARARRRRLLRVPRASSATRACSPTPARRCPPGVGTSTPEEVAAGIVPRDRAQPRGGRRRAARAEAGRARRRAWRRALTASRPAPAAAPSRSRGRSRAGQRDKR